MNDSLNIYTEEEQQKKNSIHPIKCIDCIVQFDMIIIHWTAKWVEKWRRKNVNQLEMTD